MRALVYSQLNRSVTHEALRRMTQFTRLVSSALDSILAHFTL